MSRREEIGGYAPLLDQLEIRKQGKYAPKPLSTKSNRYIRGKKTYHENHQAIPQTRQA